MKNISNKKIKNIIVSIEKHPSYKRISEEVDVLIKIAIEIFEARKKRGWTQQKLAKKAGTTQKVVSKVESADVNIGLDLLQRLARCLDLILQIGSTILVGKEDRTQQEECAFMIPFNWMQNGNQYVETRKINIKTTFNSTTTIQNN